MQINFLLWICIPIIVILLFCLFTLIVIFILQRKRKKNEQASFDYFSKIVHDLKTPIYAIDGFTLLASKNLDQPNKVEEYLNKITNISHHMLALVKDVTDLSKINSDKLEITKTIGNLIEIIDACLNNVEPQMLKRNIKFEKDVQILHPKVIADELHLNQVLTNLLSNAIKYTEPNGKISFTVEEQKLNDLTSTYIFKVKDTGYGMSEEFQKHLFEPFAQERALAHTDVESSGLGLFIVKKLIDKMNGKIEVTSKINEGSCFIVTLDLDIVETYK
ncbi:MAG: HAMP domain-containing histidine kinase [Anaeroplasmataceae bacterium]|nr:HAMP domain-containing histidine kinase [Anaeroplasmataceae bacterium]MDE6414489.1 HAMP domain-containing histidine kinase [Anaeroplasmataceae bacterium]